MPKCKYKNTHINLSNQVLAFKNVWAHNGLNGSTNIYLVGIYKIQISLAQGHKCGISGEDQTY